LEGDRELGRELQVPSLGSWATMLSILFEAETDVTIDLGIHPKHAGDPVCLCPDLAAAVPKSRRQDANSALPMCLNT